MRDVAVCVASSCAVDAVPRAAPVLRLPLLARDFDAAGRVAEAFVVRGVVPFAAVVRVADAAGRRPVRAVLAAFVVRAVAGFARAVVADFEARPVAVALAARPGLLRAVAVAFARVAAGRDDAGRVALVRVEVERADVARLEVVRVVARPVPVVDLVAAVRFAGAAALPRVVFTAAVLLAVRVPGLARVAGARVAFETVFAPALAPVFAPVLLPAVAAFATRGAFAAGLPAFAPAFVPTFAPDFTLDFAPAFTPAFVPTFFAAAERAPAVAPLRVVRAVVPRALVPAVRRPPARTAIARVRGPSDSFSVLMVWILYCLLRNVGAFARWPCSSGAGRMETGCRDCCTTSGQTCQ
ncbi:hypothetical protein [Lichenicola sp.]|uniref:hypothetical protein n=1 Tax=Lichenicola sp. TaxID=2804529 RepID=UPI003AFF81AA